MNKIIGGNIYQYNVVAHMTVLITIVICVNSLHSRWIIIGVLNLIFSLKAYCKFIKVVNIAA